GGGPGHRDHEHGGRREPRRRFAARRARSPPAVTDQPVGALLAGGVAMSAPPSNPPSELNARPRLSERRLGGCEEISKMGCDGTKDQDVVARRQSDFRISSHALRRRNPFLWGMLEERRRGPLRFPRSLSE